MAQTLELSPKKFYEEAEKMLEKKDLLGFVSKISVAIETSRNNQQMLAKSTFLEGTSLVTFNQHTKALESITEALKYNTGIKAFELERCKGIAQGYLGNIQKAKKIFTELLAKADDINFLLDVYINLSWVCLIIYKKTLSESLLEEVKHYLDLGKKHFDTLSKKRKFRLMNNYSVYYFYKEKYNEAIEILEDSLSYCEEQNLADVYNNLAELHLKVVEKDSGCECEIAKEYLKKAEVLGTRYDNNLVLGYIFFTKAMIELHEGQLFTALDTLYLSFEYFKTAEAPLIACDVLLKINDIMNEYKHNNLKSLKENLKSKLKNTPYHGKI